jgi:hypothetical protein
MHKDGYLHYRLLDWPIIGARHMAEGVINFSQWSKAILADAWPKSLPEEESLRPFLWMIYNNSKMLFERAQKVLPQCHRPWRFRALAGAPSLTISDDLLKCAEGHPDKGIGDGSAWRFDQGVIFQWRHFPSVRTARLVGIVGGPRNYASLAKVLRDTNQRWDLRIECFKSLVALGAPGYSRKGLTRFRRKAKMSKARKKARIRSAFVKAKQTLPKKLQLKGRGHVTRCSLNTATGWAVSGLKLPSGYLSVGYSYRKIYPKALVVNAAKIARIPVESLLGVLSDPTRPRRRKTPARAFRFFCLPDGKCESQHHVTDRIA